MVRILGKLSDQLHLGIAPLVTHITPANTPLDRGIRGHAWLDHRIDLKYPPRVDRRRWNRELDCETADDDERQRPSDVRARDLGRDREGSAPLGIVTHRHPGGRHLGRQCHPLLVDGPLKPGGGYSGLRYGLDFYLIAGPHFGASAIKHDLDPVLDRDGERLLHAVLLTERSYPQNIPRIHCGTQKNCCPVAQDGNRGILEIHSPFKRLAGRVGWRDACLYRERDARVSAILIAIELDGLHRMLLDELIVRQRTRNHGDDDARHQNEWLQTQRLRRANLESRHRLGIGADIHHTHPRPKLVIILDQAG